MDVYRLALALPSALMLVALIFHCYKTRGPRTTLIVFAAGIPVFWGREYLSLVKDHYMGMPQYYHPDAKVLIGPVPLPVIVGWLINTYLGWTLGERIAARIDAFRGRVFAVAFCAALVISSMGLCVEATGVEMGWWVWTKQALYESTDPFARYLHRAPFISLLGWPVTTLAWLLPILLLEYSPLRERLGPRRWLWFIPWLAIYTPAMLYAFDSAGRWLLAIFVCLVLFSRLKYVTTPNPAHAFNVDTPGSGAWGPALRPSGERSPT